MLSSSTPTSLALAILAEEEFAKGFLLALVDLGVVPWNKAVRRATRDHSCKHLLLELMKYADPDIDDVESRSKRFHARHEAIMKLLDDMRRLPPLRAVEDFRGTMATIHKQNELWRKVASLEREQEREDAFPPYIADAINILRHKKIGRWEEGFDYDDEKYDARAKAIADGAIDREKQRAIYIDLDGTGAVSSRPEEIGTEEVELAIAGAKKMRGPFTEFWNMADPESSSKL